jgi:hypothetical protein
VSSQVPKEPPRSSEPETVKPFGASKSYPVPSQSLLEPAPGLNDPSDTPVSTVAPLSTIFVPVCRSSTDSRSESTSSSAAWACPRLHPFAVASSWVKLVNTTVQLSDGLVRVEVKVPAERSHVIVKRLAEGLATVPTA